MSVSETGSMVRKRDEKGRVKLTYTLDDVHAALAEIGPAGTQEVADEVGCAYETAWQKLDTLEDEGRVTSRKVANARLWTAIEDENEEVDDG